MIMPKKILKRDLLSRKISNTFKAKTFSKLRYPEVDLKGK